jgi:hypothetical protein
MKDFHEVWWIYSPMIAKEWGGLRIAHFRKTAQGFLIVNITGEIDQRRVGPRVWIDIQRTELWYKVKQIPVPTIFEIGAAAIQDRENEI